MTLGRYVAGIFAANPNAGFCRHDKQELHMLVVAGGGTIKRALERVGPEKASIKAISKI
jgi:hypothetical protein